MNRKVLPTGYQQMNITALQDPRVLEQYVQQTFGMSANQLDQSLKALMPIAQGNRPDGAEMQFIVQTAQQRYGWSPERTSREISKVLSYGSAEERIAAYLTANGMSDLNPHEYQTAVGLTQHSIRADLEVDLQNRLNTANGNNAPGKPYEGMQAHKNVAADSASKSDLRNTISTLMGVNDKPNYQSKVQQVIKARHQLADRIDAQVIKEASGYEPTLRDSLAQSYDEAVINEASNEVGLGSPMDDAKEIAQETEHLHEDYDVTAGLND